jgi:serine/threonine protein kinase
MFNLLEYFNQSDEIDSGGAEVHHYNLELYRKTFNMYEEKDYDERSPFGVNNKIHYNNEKNCLTVLEEYDISPKIMDSNDNSLLLSECGERIDNENLPDDWKEQLITIHEILEYENIYHNDIKPDNFTVKDKKIYLIDYGWASEGMPGYPYLNLNLKIINDSKSFNELFHNIYNKSSKLILECSLYLNEGINDLRNTLTDLRITR